LKGKTGVKTESVHFQPLLKCQHRQWGGMVRR